MGERRKPRDSVTGADLRRRRTDQPRPPAIRLPLGWVAVDGIGAMLFGLGATERYASLPLLSRFIARGDVATIAMVAGGVLMAVAMTVIVGSLLKRR